MPPKGRSLSNPKTSPSIERGRAKYLAEQLATKGGQAALPSVPRSVKDPLTSDEHNVGGTLRVFWGAHQSGVRRVVYAASSSASSSSWAERIAWARPTR